ncbi:hypothetical protein GXW82_39395 [Streptacidiphilus sp. 4-A2]|nr:hypothetical protein [Streptacidiphilus sp. 4-A2]
MEGSSDERYLSSLITKQLRQTVLDAGTDISVKDCVLCPCRITGTGDSGLVDTELRELALDCHLLFVHSDDKERETAYKRISTLRVNTVDLPQHRRAEPVPLVPVRMVESWMLADRQAVARAVGGADLSKYPYRNPADVEKARNDPEHPHYAKKVWKALVGSRRERDFADRAEALVEQTDLRILAQLPSYQQWLSDTEAALKLKGFL